MKKGARVHLLISGRVQGVLFRDRTKARAKKLGLFGWVKNLSDGRVEAVLEGEEENIFKLIEWAKRGPIFARVDNVIIKWEDYKGEFNKFNIQY